MTKGTAFGLVFSICPAQYCVFVDNAMLPPPRYYFTSSISDWEQPI